MLRAAIQRPIAVTMLFAALLLVGELSRERLAVDPGIGFGKRPEDNWALLANAGALGARLGLPVCVGPSRKSFLGAILDVPPNERIEGTIVANTASILNGASIIRVHDVKEGRRTADVATRLRGHVPASH